MAPKIASRNVQTKKHISAATDTLVDKEVKRKSSDREKLEEFSPMNETGRDMFELFHTYDGEEYTVYTRDDGKKFYVDWEEQVS